MEPKVGETVILDRGKGRKRKYNGHEATILSVPKKGSWMTVQIHSELLKWRKGGTKEPAVLGILAGDTVAHILSFLGTNLWVKDAMLLSANLALVSRAWHSVCRNHGTTIFDLVDANLDAISTIWNVVPSIMWMCRHKVTLASLRCTCGLGDVAMLQELLEECNTERLTNVLAFVDKSGSMSPDRSLWISSAYRERFDPDGATTYDLTRYNRLRTLETEAESLGIPFGRRTLTNFHDSLATHCPNVETLSVNIYMGCEYSAQLFALDSITNLELSSTYVDERSANDVMQFTRIIRNLLNLHSLSIKMAGQVFSHKRFHVKSNHLKVLDVSAVAKATMVSCECPQLEQYICKKGVYPRGALFRWTSEEEIDEIEDKYVSQVDRYSEQLKAPVGALDVIGVIAPDDCMFTMTEYGRPLEFMLAVAENVVAAPLPADS